MPMTPTPKRPAVVRWTSAKRPPKDNEDVLVWLPWLELQLVGFYEGDGAWYIYDQGTVHDIRVSHWRPLPPPPRVRKR